jgi:DNA-binding NarL/FixJ family response regulator
MKTVLIADDHEIVRQGIRMILESLGEPYTFLEAFTVADALAHLKRQHVHFAVLDMSLADGNMFSKIDQITTDCPHTKVLVYSMNDEKIYGRRLFQKGIRGFVCKQSSINELEKALRTLVAGEIYFSAALKEEIARSIKSGTSAENPLDRLSDRELEVVEYISAGMGTKEISYKMNLDITTISTYRKRAYDKLGVQNVVELNEITGVYRS